MNRREFFKTAAVAACATPFAAKAGSAPMDINVYSKKLETLFDVDVCVAGGGPSGLAAAIMAARKGAKVVLLEAGTCFGGSGTQAGIPMFCMPTDGVNLTSAGFGSEVYGRIVDAGAAMPGTTRENMYKYPTLHFRCEAVKRVYDAMVVESGIAFRFGVRIVDAETDADGRVRRAVCSGKGGLFAVKARTFVDATGDGDLSYFAGALWEYGDAEGNVQASTLPSIWAGIDWAEAVKKGGGMWTHERHLREAIAAGVFTVPDTHLPGIFMAGDNSGYGNVGHVYVDARNDKSLTDAFVAARKYLVEYENYYRKYIPGFGKAELVGTGALMGIRESRRIMGDYKMTYADYGARRHFEDDIGCYNYPVDLHAAKPGVANADKALKNFKASKYQKGENYGIPYRALVPQKLTNVLVAGRCMSCDRSMEASIRVMPGCFITGQAAGLAAAIAVKEHGGTVRDVPIGELRDSLRSISAYLGEKTMT